MDRADAGRPGKARPERGVHRPAPEAAEDALHGEDPVAREAARTDAARTPGGLEAALAALASSDRVVCRRAGRILGSAPLALVGPLLEAALSDAGRPTRVRAAAVRALGVAAGRDGAVELAALGRALADPDPPVRRAAVSRAAPTEALVRALADPDPGVVDRAARALANRDTEVDLEPLRAAVEGRPDPPEALLRLLAARAPEDPALRRAARALDPVALDHLTHGATWTELLAGEARVAAAWALARTTTLPPELAGDPDPRVRAAAARALPPSHPALARLATDEDPSVAWTAFRALEGAFEPSALRARLGPHARSASASARPPYGVPPGEPAPARAEAALALCHPRLDVNLGVAVRSAEAAGLREVLVVGRPGWLRGPAQGTEQVLPVRHLADAAALIRHGREQGYQLVAVQQTPASVPYLNAPYPPRPLFLVGSEDEGLPESLRSEADLVVEIPMHGAVDSLNVAAAATCVVFAWRARAGTEGASPRSPEPGGFPRASGQASGAGTARPEGGRVRIRRLGATDSVAELTALLHRAYAALAGAGMHYVASHQSEDVTRSRAESGECWVAEDGGRLVGTVVFQDAAGTSGCPWFDRPGVASFHQFGVEPALQGSGIGARLLERVEARAAETGASEIALDTAECATGLIETYGRRGYAVVGEADWPETNYASVIMARPVGGATPSRRMT